MEEQNILERIHASYYHLTAAERKVADYVLGNHDQVQFMSITQLADECGTAEATVSRFCRSLKLKGFNAFKIEIAKYSAAAAQQPRDQDPGTIQGRCAKAGQLSADAIRQTVELAEPEKLLRAVEFFEDAPRILCMGSGGSMIVAQECCHLFSTVTGKFFPVTDAHSQLSAVATMDQRDVIVLFSYSGATTSGLQVLQLARERRVRTVLVTRFHKSPAAKLATVTLRCGSNEGPFQAGSIPAKVAQLLVMDLLYQEYCHRNREAVEENIRRVASALAGQHV